MFKSKIALLLGCMIAASTLCSVTAKAQTKADTTIHATVVAPSNAQIIDSLGALINKVSNDTAAVKVITGAISTISKTPAEKSTGSWILYAITVAGALFGVYQYYKHKTAVNSTLAKVEQHLSVLASPASKPVAAKPGPAVAKTVAPAADTV